MGLNVRVMKFSKEFLEREGLFASDKAYFMTGGYSGNIFDCSKRVVITYCPFCGIKLSQFYKNDDYVQEIVTI